MNKKLYVNVLQRLLEEKEDKSLEEFSGVAAVGGFTGPLGAPVPKVGSPILSAPKKKKKSKKLKLTESDPNFRYSPKIDSDKIKINQKNWRYEKEKELLENFMSLLTSANIKMTNQKVIVDKMKEVFLKSQSQNVSQIKNFVKKEMEGLHFTTNVFSKLNEEILKELTIVNKTTKEKLKDGKEDISEDEIKQAISKAYGNSAVDIFSKISLKEKPVSVFQYAKDKISNAYSYTINAFKIILSSIGIKTMFEEGGIDGILKKVVKEYLGVDIDSIMNEIGNLKNKIASSYSTIKQKAKGAFDYITGNDTEEIAQKTSDAVSDESKQDLMQSTWDSFWVWDKYVVYILTAIAVINIISIYMIWRNSKTNKREALNHFIHDQIGQAYFDNELANILAKDAAIVVLNKYFEEKGRPLIENKFKYYKKPLTYHLL
jgi:hypothetical protein